MTEVPVVDEALKGLTHPADEMEVEEGSELVDSVVTDISPKSRVLKVIGGVCGSGKSYNIARHVLAESRKGKLFIFALPTLVMVYQTRDSLVARAEEKGWDTSEVKRQIIMLSSEYESVLPQLLDYIVADPNSRPRVIITTHKSMENLARGLTIGFGGDIKSDDVRRGLMTCSVFCDEIPAPLIYANVTVNDGEKHMFLSAIKRTEFEKTDGEKVDCFAIKMKSDTVSNEEGQDLVEEDFRKHQPKARQGLISTLRADSYKETTQNLGYILLKGGRLFTRNKSEKSVVYQGVAGSPLLDLLCWVEDFYLMAANASDSPFTVAAQTYKRYGAVCEVEDAPHHLWPAKQRRTHPEEIQARVNASSMIKGRATSTKLYEDGGEVFKKVLKTIADKKLLDFKQSFIWVANHDKPTFSPRGEAQHLFSKVAPGKAYQIPYVSNGLNVFGGEAIHNNEYSSSYGLSKTDLQDGLTQAAWLGVAHLSPDEKMMIRNPDLIRAIERHNTAEVAYQMVARTAFRDQSTVHSDFNFIFIDDESLDYFISRYAPKAKVIHRGLVTMPNKRLEAADASTMTTYNHLFTLEKKVAKAALAAELGITRPTLDTQLKRIGTDEGLRSTLEGLPAFDYFKKM